jgi:hypothetical protein
MTDCVDELPGTLPVHHSQQSPAIEATVWGTLLSRTKDFPSIDLTSEDITFGRKNSCLVHLSGEI